MFEIISSLLRYDNGVQEFWDYEYEIMVWDMIWWVLMPADLGFELCRLCLRKLTCWIVYVLWEKYELRVWSWNVNIKCLSMKHEA
jgi:hypothetical protein